MTCPRCEGEGHASWGQTVCAACMLELSTYQHVAVPVQLSPNPEPKSRSDAVGVMLAKCFKHISRFNAWEKEFLYSLNDQRERYADWEATHKQRTSLLKIFTKLPREKSTNDQT